MNVLLAEANVPYEQLVEMDEINPQFPTTDVVLVIGANDVVNPAARVPGTPISGMPILDVDLAANVIFLKRSMRPGFAGIDDGISTRQHHPAVRRRQGLPDEGRRVAQGAVAMPDYSTPAASTPPRTSSTPTSPTSRTCRATCRG